MSERSAHELTRTRFCRERQCEEAAVTGERGRYANLCGDHLAAAKQRTNGTAPAAAPTSSSYELRARHLVGVGRQVDKAIAKAAKTREACEPTLRKAREAKTEADRLLEQFKQTVRELAT